ncbi:MAG: efflux RND transporter periplasmic adaptor subunit [Cytophagaceae bacterium]
MKKILMLIGLVAVLFETGCHEHEMHESKTKFLVTSPLVGDTTINREYVCQIRAIQHIELRALEKGYLQEIFVDEGKFVPKGQLMFRIMPLIYQAEVGRAQAEADYAEVEYSATKALADSNIVAPRELALAKAKLEKAKAELALMQTHLQFTQIKAPFNGIMDRFHVRLGSLLDEGDLLTTMSDISTLWVYFNVPEAEYLDYKSREQQGDALLNVQLKMANQEMFKYPGVVKTIEADFNNETGTIAFRATFPNPDNLLRHGETGNIVVTIPLKKSIIIPQKATFEVLDQKYVYVVDKDNVLKTRRIHVSAELPDLYVISEGLNEKDKILLEGLRLVNENDKIEYEYQDPKFVMSHLKLHAE